MRRLLDEIDSPDLAVVFDPVNLLNETNFHSQREVLRVSLELLGNDIAVVHAKDFRLDGERLETCPAGTGMLDYRTFLPDLGDRSPGIAILLEEAGPEAAGFSRQFIQRTMTPFFP